MWQVLRLHCVRVPWSMHCWRYRQSTMSNSQPLNQGTSGGKVCSREESELNKWSQEVYIQIQEVRIMMTDHWPFFLCGICATKIDWRQRQWRGNCTVQLFRVCKHKHWVIIQQEEHNPLQSGMLHLYYWSILATRSEHPLGDLSPQMYEFVLSPNATPLCFFFAS